MKHRDLLLLTSGLALLAALGVLVLDHGAPASLGEPVGEAPEPLPEPEPMAVTAPVEPPQPLVLPVEERQARAVDTEGWTSGLIVGDIQLATSVIGRIQSISVTVAENRQPRREGEQMVRPYQRTIRVPLGVGTPTFELRDVPFSRYGYTVRAYSTGLNGTAQTVRLDEREPYQEVLLGLMPGVPFSILLRDQEQNPVHETDVTMAPVGDPPGRPTHKGTTDNFGSVVFQDVLAGPYRVFVGHVEQPMVEPVDVTVQLPGRSFAAGQPVRGQLHQIEVPHGVDLVVAVVGPAGYGIEGVSLKLLATDKVRLRVLEGETDYSGRHTFRHLPPGTYQLDAAKPDHERRTKSVTFQKGEIPPEQVIRMSPIR